MPRRLRRSSLWALSGVLAAVATVLALGLAPTQAAAAGVALTRPDGSTTSLALNSLAGAEDVRERPYLVREGGAERTLTVTGFSLGLILERLGLAPGSATFVAVTRAQGGSVLLATSALGGDDGPAVVFATATGGTAFLRPSTGADDENGTDLVEAPGELALALRGDDPFRVDAKPSRERIEPGGQIDFKALLSDGIAARGVTFNWYIDAQTTLHGQRVSHRFKRRGSYLVTVEATIPGNDFSASDSVLVEVGKSDGSPARAGSGGNRRREAPVAGSSGGEPQGPPPTAGAAPAAVDRDRPSAAGEPQEPPRKAAAPARAPGEQVVGELLSGASRTAPAAEVVASRSGNPRPEAPHGMSVPGMLWALAALLGLLGVGAWLEARRGQHVTQVT